MKPEKVKTMNICLSCLHEAALHRPLKYVVKLPGHIKKCDICSEVKECFFFPGHIDDAGEFLNGLGPGFRAKEKKMDAEGTSYRMEMFFMCLVDGTPSCRHKHATLEEAKAEAERLAIQTGKGVSVLASILRCNPRPLVEWVNMETGMQGRYPDAD